MKINSVLENRICCCRYCLIDEFVGVEARAGIVFGQAQRGVVD